MVERVNFLYVEVNVYPASIKPYRTMEGYDWDTVLIARNLPVLSTYENIGICKSSLSSYNADLHKGIQGWIKDKMLEKGKELLYKNCPTKAPKE